MSAESDLPRDADTRVFDKAALESGVVVFAGALDVVPTGSGLSPRRLPEWTKPEIPDLLMEHAVASPSGVRLAFRSSARALELEVAVPDRDVRNGAALPPALFDLTVDGGAGATSCALQAGETTVRFAGLPAGPKELELWLPQDRKVEVRRLRADAELEPPRREERPRWIHHGSSISQCRRAFSPTQTWPALAARRGGYDLLNLGFGGSCHLDPFVARTIAREPADFISLKIGINIVGQDTLKLRTFAPALHGFLATIRDGHPDTPVLVVSPVVCPALEDRAGPLERDREGRIAMPATPGPAETDLTLRRLRAEVERVVGLRAQHDPQLRYLDGLELFGPGDAGDLPDGLHPNGAGYLRIGDRFASLVFERPARPRGASP